MVLTSKFIRTNTETIRRMSGLAFMFLDWLFLSSQLSIVRYLMNYTLECILLTDARFT